MALVGYHETRPAEDEEEIAAAEFVEAGAIPGGDFAAGQILVGSKDEQERLFQEAEREYEQRMSKLADAKMAADSKVEQDKDRDLRVVEMENAIERAMDARLASQRSGTYKLDVGAELSDAQARTHLEAQSQRSALENARKTAQQPGMSGLESVATNNGFDTAQLDAYLDSMAQDRERIKAMEDELQRVESRAPDTSRTAATNIDTNKESLAQALQGLAAPIKDTQGKYLEVLMESCASLPALVVSEIQTEVSGLLDAKISGKLDELHKGLIGQGSNAMAAAAPISVENPSNEQLISGLAYLVSLAQDESVTPSARAEASSKFALSLIKSGDVRQEIEPMVALLVTYAQARLNEN